MAKFRNAYNNNRIFNITIAVGILTMLGIMLYGISFKELWFDEMAIVGFMRTGVSFREMMGYYLTIEATNLPLYQIIVRFFYELLPAKVGFLAIPSILFTLSGVIILVKFVDEIVGREAAYSVLIISALSTTMINRLGLQCRAYALLFFASTLSIIAVKRLLDSVNKKNLLFAIIAFLILIFTHYFGTLLFGILSLIILFYCLVQKISIKAIIPSTIAGCVFLPWFLLAMSSRTQGIDSFWIDKPNIKSVADTIGFLLGGNYIACMLWGMGIILAIIISIKTKKLLDFKYVISFLPLIIIGVMFAISYISNSLYENRYFIILLPELSITIGILFQWIFDTIKGKKYEILVMLLSLILLLTTAITMGDRCILDAACQFGRFSDSANYIKEEGDIEQDNVLLIIRQYRDVDLFAALGWYDFFFYRRGIEAKNIEAKDSGENVQTKLMNTYSDQVDKVYLIAPYELIEYDGDIFAQTYQDTFCNLTVYEKVK